MTNGTRRGWGVSVTPWPLFTPGKDKVPIVQEAGWAPGPVWTGAENLTHTGIRTPDRPARSQSLYRLSYPAHEDDSGFSQFCERTFKIYKPVLEVNLSQLHSIISQNTLLLCTNFERNISGIFLQTIILIWYRTTPNLITNYSQQDATISWIYLFLQPLYFYSFCKNK